MKIAEINTVHYGSTGKIMLQIASAARNNSHTVKTFSKKWKKSARACNDHFYIGSMVENFLCRIIEPVISREGAMARFSTFRLICKLKRFGPDVIHLHNLHGWYVNLAMLFKYIKKNKVKVVWTLHDCWAFTGHCPYFAITKCDKWKIECNHCPQLQIYPEMYVDTSRKMYNFKKKWFCGVNDLTIITPSQWLADLTRESFLMDYPVKVINNGIDLSVFRPRTSDFRRKHHCEDKYLLLGVAFDWGIRKGLDVFVELAGRLPENYQIVLVGTDDKVDKQLPDNIISIHRTQDQTELAEIYTAADLFVNPTREDNYPTVNMESLACGTPVLTFRTGGSPECIDETCGSVVDCDDVDAMEKEIFRICTQRPYSLDACLNRAKEFDMNERFEEYVKLYEKT